MTQFVVCVTSSARDAGAVAEAFRTTTGLAPDSLMDVGARRLVASVGEAGDRGRHPSAPVTVLTYGDVLAVDGNPAEALAHRFVEQGDAFGTGVYGSWAALVVDGREDRILAVTDRLGSVRLFHAWVDGDHWIASRPGLLPTDRLPLDPIGIAWYLSNGAVHTGRTLFRGVAVLPAASVQELDGSGTRGHEYWPVPFPPDGPYDEVELGRELLEHVRAGVRRCVPPDGTLWASMSGGYDSCVLGAVLREQGVGDVETFTYAHGEVVDGSDARVGGEVARILGYPHRVVESYDGDLLSHIVSNARVGEGMVHPCDEVDAWRRLDPGRDPDGRRPVLLVGDHWITDAPQRRAASVRRGSRPPGKLLTAEAVRWLAPAVGREAYRAWNEGMSEDVLRILDEPAESPKAWHDVYLRERTRNVLLPWRKAFASRRFTVRSPLLDNDVLDFMGTVPVQARDGNFYHDAVIRAYPDVFAVPRAVVPGYAIGLPREVMLQGRRCLDELGTMPSRLDEALPSTLGAWILDRATTPSFVARIRKRLDGFRGGRDREDEGRWHVPVLGAPEIFRRYMILRTALAPE